MYSDGWADDARLVVLNALDARARGARTLTRTRCTEVQRGDQAWRAKLQTADGRFCKFRARAVVNATGPWAALFLNAVARSANGEQLATRRLRLIKCSHMVVRRLFSHPHAYILQTTDKRVIFAIPYQDDFTLIGTTDIEWSGSAAGPVSIDQAEIEYLCVQASRYFAKPVSTADLVWSYAVVRPLLDDEAGDPSAVTRDYLLEQNKSSAPLLSVWGGKITTFRKLSEDAADAVGSILGERRQHWTANAFLAGGDLSEMIESPAEAGLPQDRFTRFLKSTQLQYEWLPATLVRRMAHAYGGRIHRVLGSAASPAALGAKSPRVVRMRTEVLARRGMGANLR